MNEDVPTSTEASDEQRNDQKNQPDYEPQWIFHAEKKEMSSIREEFCIDITWTYGIRAILLKFQLAWRHLVEKYVWSHAQP